MWEVRIYYIAVNADARRRVKYISPLLRNACYCRRLAGDTDGNLREDKNWNEYVKSITQIVMYVYGRRKFVSSNKARSASKQSVKFKRMLSKSWIVRDCSPKNAFALRFFLYIQEQNDRLARVLLLSSNILACTTKYSSSKMF